jgi:hypothetical protein
MIRNFAIAAGLLSALVTATATAVPELFSDDQTLLGIDGITFIGDTLWYGERMADRAHSMPLPK